MTPSIALHTRRPSAVDSLRSEHVSVAAQVLGVVGFAVLTAAAAQVRIYLWEVPFTLQTAAVFASGLYLGARNGFLAQVLYLALGMFLPVFAGSEFGPAYLFGGVTAGYLLAAPAAAVLIGSLSKRWNSLAGSTLTLVLGSLVVFAAGVAWLHVAAGHTTWFESVDKGFLRFAATDLAKLMFVSLLYTGSRRIG